MPQALAGAIAADRSLAGLAQTDLELAKVLAALIALVVANSPAHEVVREILEVQMSFSLGMIHAHIALETFVNDFLMAIFFLLVGIELKYEVTVGQLRKPRQAMLPMLAAVGGVAVPALIAFLIIFAVVAKFVWPSVLRMLE